MKLEITERDRSILLAVSSHYYATLNKNGVEQNSRLTELNKDAEILFERIKNLKDIKQYCCEVEREMEENCILHFDWEGTPTRKDVLKLIEEEDIGYDDNYGRFTFWEV